jgi:hypothetical protein
MTLAMRMNTPTEHYVERNLKAVFERMAEQG